jgi:hypothetical protein
MATSKRMATTAASTTTEAGWAQVFANRAGRHSDVGVTAEDIEAAGLTVGTLDALGRSLNTFMIGESGTGDHLRSAAAVSGAGAEHRAALVSFIREEQEHARLLGIVLDAMDYPCRSTHWSQAVFERIRRSKSLRTEVLTLLVAELIALTYYSAMRDRFPVFADVFGRIHDDEVDHVAFHADTLPVFLDRWSVPVRHGVRFGWNVLVLGASIVAAVDHRHALAEAGMRPSEFVRRVSRDRQVLDRRLFGRRGRLWRLMRS